MYNIDLNYEINRDYDGNIQCDSDFDSSYQDSDDRYVGCPEYKEWNEEWN